MNQIYRFPMNQVMQLIEHVKGSEQFYHPYFAKWPKPGLLLVRSNGVYLMSNGFPAMPHPKKEDEWFVAHAKGFDLDKDEDFYKNKVRVWGGDDGIEFLPIEDAIAGVEELSNQGLNVFTVELTNEEGEIGGCDNIEELESLNYWDTELICLRMNATNIKAMEQRDASLIGVLFSGSTQKIPRKELENDLEDAKPHLQPDEIWLCENVLKIVYGSEQ